MSISFFGKQRISDLLAESGGDIEISPDNNGGVRIGANSQISSECVAIGASAGASGGGVSIGASAGQIAKGSDSVGVGRFAGYDGAGTKSIAIGCQAGQNSAGSYSTTIGTEANYAGGNAGGFSTAVGARSRSIGYGSGAFGFDANATGTDAYALCSSASATNTGALACGQTSEATASYSAAFGSGAQAVHANSTCIGRNSMTTDSEQIKLGTSADTVSIPGNLEVGGNFDTYVDFSTRAFHYGLIGGSTFVGQWGHRDLFESLPSSPFVASATNTGILTVTNNVSVNVGGGVTVPMTIFSNPTEAQGGRTRVAIVTYYYLPDTGSAQPRLTARLIKVNPDGVNELPGGLTGGDESQVVQNINADVTATVGGTGFVVLAPGDGFGAIRLLGGTNSSSNRTIYQAVLSGVLL